MEDSKERGCGMADPGMIVNESGVGTGMRARESWEMESKPRLTPTEIKNCQRRKLAKTIIALGMEELKTEDDDEFFKVLIEEAQAKMKKKRKKKTEENQRIAGNESPMNERMAIKFERETMEWGKYKDEHIGMIETEYLVWLTEGNTFIDRLKRYVKSERFKNRQRSGE